MVTATSAHRLFAVTLFVLVFRLAGDPLWIAIAEASAGFAMIAMADCYARRHGKD